mmetsp:Transcript_90665/g.210904  ORF Transcript_90665/g.210904 Transcript_90665/m.210904 type:complete len:152 (-) Transcript_90665:68-523(-)
MAPLSAASAAPRQSRAASPALRKSVSAEEESSAKENAPGNVIITESAELSKPAEPSEPTNPRREDAKPRTAMAALLAKPRAKPLLLFMLLMVALLLILTWGSTVYVAAPRLFAVGVGTAACAVLAVFLGRPVARVAQAAVQAARVAWKRKE